MSNLSKEYLFVTKDILRYLKESYKLSIKFLNKENQSYKFYTLYLDTIQRTKDNKKSFISQVVIRYKGVVLQITQ